MEMKKSDLANAGENQVHYSETVGGGEGPKTTMSAGVQDGLSSFEKLNVKDCEGVTDDQRPKGNTDSIGGGMTIGVL